MRRRFSDNFAATEVIHRAVAVYRLARSAGGKLVLITVLAGFGASILSACSPFYVLRAAYEEGKILWRREPIAQFLEKSEVNQETQEKLKLVLAVREYARDVLKMNVGGSYTSYSYVDRPDLTYILTAAPKTELKPYTWWFLIVGRVPYKGYFSKADAEAAAADLQFEGYDTNIRPSAAFSTLGWFDDPLLSHLLRYDKVTLSEVVFHELFHNTLYVKGAGAFNESVANFVGGRAAIDFFRDRFGENSTEHQKAIQAWQEELEFSDFMEKLGESLSKLYGKEISLEEKLRLREHIFESGKKEWEERIAARPGHRFRGFAKQPLNNAVMIHYLLYLKNLELFEAVYEAKAKNLIKVIDAIREAVKEGGEPFDAVRLLLPGGQT
ncbi:MAG: aminopeptidase [Deltaproteobacteria bacterium]|nr:aminopeptidase [Deltaproteobacteria bacterium]MDZ4344640.1 aminopeptidase [Candidatus Binatia bacterium]